MGGGLSGNKTHSMLHLTCEQTLTAPPVGAVLFLHVGPVVTPDKFPLRGLDLVNNPSGPIDASVCYMCIDLSCFRRLNNVFLAPSRSFASLLDAPGTSLLGILKK